MIKKKLFQAFLIVLLLAASANLYDRVDKEKVNLNGDELKAEIASTKNQRKRGLSNKKELAEEEGMLFIFEEEDFHSIWMKDMNFAIDIIWINNEKEIVDIKNNIAPHTYPETFSPSEPAKYVLEVKAGFAEDKDLEIGDKTDF